MILDSIGLFRTALAAATVVLGATAASGTETPYEPAVTFERLYSAFHVRADGTYESFLEYRIRVNTPQAIRTYGSQSVEYIASQEDVVSIEAWTIQPDGRRLPVPESAIRTQDEQAGDEGAEFSDTKFKVIIFPNVEVGSTLHYKVRTNRHVPVYPNHFHDVTTYSRQFPIEDAQLHYVVPSAMKMAVEKQGVEGGLEKTEGGFDHYRFRYRSVGAIPWERGRVALQDYGNHVRISNWPDMLDMGRAYQETSLPKAKVTDDIRRLALKLTADAPDERTKVRRLYEWVATNVRYVAVFMGDGRLIPHEAQEVLQKRYGDCKDHVVLLEALLAAVGIPSSAALVNLGNAYSMPAIGVVAPLNHVITYVPSLDLYLDSTVPFAPFGQLPFSAMDKPVVLAALGRMGRTPRMEAGDHRIKVDYALKIDPQGRIHGTAAARYAGVPEIESRRARFESKSRSPREVVKDLLYRFNETGEGSMTFPPPERIDQPYWIDSRFVLNPVSNIPGRGAFMLPVGLAPGGIAMIGSNASLEQSFHYPCRSFVLEENFAIELPENIRLDGMPEGASFRDEAVTYASTYEAAGRRVVATRKLAVQYPSSVCAPIQHNRWRAFHRFLQRDLRQQIFYR